MQQELMIFDFNEALDVSIQAAGGVKRVASDLFPEKKLEAAARYLNDCLNQEKREKLSMEQIIFIAKKAKENDCHALLEYLSDELGYEKPKPLNIETEQQKLQRDFIKSQEKMERLINQMKKLSGVEI